MPIAVYGKPKRKTKNRIGKPHKKTRNENRKACLFSCRAVLLLKYNVQTMYNVQSTNNIQYTKYIQCTKYNVHTMYTKIVCTLFVLYIIHTMYNTNNVQTKIVLVLNCINKTIQVQYRPGIIVSNV